MIALALIAKAALLTALVAFAVAFFVAVGRLIQWVSASMVKPSPVVEAEQEREVRAGRFPDVAEPRRNRGQHGARKTRIKEAARRERRRRR